MAAPIPATKAGGVIARTNLLIRDLTHYLPEDDARVQELLRDAKSGIKTVAAEAYSALACVHELTGNRKAAIYCIDNAIQLAPSEATFKANKCSILLNLGFFAEAQPLFQRTADPELGFMTMYWHRGFTCGAYQTMVEHLSKARKMGIEVEGLDTATAEKAAMVLVKTGTNQAELGRVLDVAGEVLRDNRLFYVGKQASVTVFDEPGQSPFIQMVYQVGISADEAVDLYFDFVDRVTARFPNLPSALTVGFRSTQKKSANERRPAEIT
jgi:hypothetical protein